MRSAHKIAGTTRSRKRHAGNSASAVDAVFDAYPRQVKAKLLALALTYHLGKRK
jgi:hypothetical protein